MLAALVLRQLERWLGYSLDATGMAHNPLCVMNSAVEGRLRVERDVRPLFALAEAGVAHQPCRGVPTEELDELMSKWQCASLTAMRSPTHHDVRHAYSLAFHHKEISVFARGGP
jgi:hypothetical protein